MTIYQTDSIVVGHGPKGEKRTVDKVTARNLVDILEYVDDVSIKDVCQAFDDKYKGTPVWQGGEDDTHSLKEIEFWFPIEEKVKAVLELTDENWILLEYGGFTPVRLAKLEPDPILNDTKHPRFITDRTIEKITEDDEELPKWIEGHEDWLKVAQVKLCASNMERTDDECPSCGSNKTVRDYNHSDKGLIICQDCGRGL